MAGLACDFALRSRDVVVGGLHYSALGAFMSKRIDEWLKRHWDGQVIENEPYSPVFIIGIRYPPLRRGWMALCSFFKAHWQFLITITVAIIGVIVAALH